MNKFLVVILLFLGTYCASPPKKFDKGFYVGIRDTILNNHSALNECYLASSKAAKAEAKSPPEGKLTLDFEIAMDGLVKYAKVDEPRSQIKDELLSSCVCDIVKKLAFPKRTETPSVQVFYPLAFGLNKKPANTAPVARESK